MTTYAQRYILGSALLALSIAAFFRVGEVIGNALEQKYLYDTFALTPAQTVPAKATPSRRGGAVKRVLSVYSNYYLGRTTRYGEKYTGEGLTVASNEWKYNTRLRITYKSKSLVVRVTDTMAKRYTGIRVDASHRVWRELTGAKPGLRTVTVEVVK